MNSLIYPIAFILAIVLLFLFLLLLFKGKPKNKIEADTTENIPYEKRSRFPYEFILKRPEGMSFKKYKAQQKFVNKMLKRYITLYQPNRYYIR